jgi:hypothetical protein
VLDVHPGDRIAAQFDLDAPFGSVGLPALDHLGDPVIVTAAHCLRGKGHDWYCGSRSSSGDVELHSVLVGGSTTVRPRVNPKLDSNWNFGHDAGYVKLNEADWFQVHRSIPEAGNEPFAGAGWAVPAAISSTPVQPHVGMTVWKRGAATGITVGTIEEIDDEPMRAEPKAVWWSAPQVIVSPDGGFVHFAEGGDSGSIVCDVDGNPVALHVGGSTHHRLSFGIVLDAVIDRLDITL